MCRVDMRNLKDMNNVRSLNVFVQIGPGEKHASHSVFFTLALGTGFTDMTCTKEYSIKLFLRKKKY